MDEADSTGLPTGMGPPTGAIGALLLLASNERGLSVREQVDQVIVTNTGPLISPADMDRIFPPFQRLSERTSHQGLCLDCADICTAAAGVTSRPGGYEAEVTRPLLEACVASCRTCGDECERHAEMHEHCRVCAEACRKCQQVCQQLLAALK